MTLRKIWNIVKWNYIEFIIYLSFGLVLPLLILIYSRLIDIGISTIATMSTVLFTVFIGIFFSRFFFEFNEINNLISNFQVIRELLFVWTEGIPMIGRRWLGQLQWLETQKEERSDNDKRILMPHKFRDIPISIINKIPIKKGDINFKLLRNSLISINHKIEHLNFIIEIVYYRESIDDDESREMKSLVFNRRNPTSVLSTLSLDIPQTIQLINKNLCKLGGL